MKGFEKATPPHASEDIPRLDKEAQVMLGDLLKAQRENREKEPDMRKLNRVMGAIERGELPTVPAEAEELAMLLHQVRRDGFIAKHFPDELIKVIGRGAL